jgi:hypothetical protein
MPVSQKIKAAGRTLIGVGTRKSTNRHWAKSCHEFRYYENLVEPTVAEPVAAQMAEGRAPAPEVIAVAVDPAAELLRRAVRLLAEKKGDTWVNKGEIWPMIKRLDPTFDLKENGHTSFSGMVKALEAVVEVKKGDNDQLVRLR